MPLYGALATPFDQILCLWSTFVTTCGESLLRCDVAGLTPSAPSSSYFMFILIPCVLSHFSILCIFVAFPSLSLFNVSFSTVYLYIVILLVNLSNITYLLIYPFIFIHPFIIVSKYATRYFNPVYNWLIRSMHIDHHQFGCVNTPITYSARAFRDIISIVFSVINNQ